MFTLNVISFPNGSFITHKKHSVFLLNLGEKNEFKIKGNYFYFVFDRKKVLVLIIFCCLGLH